MGKEGDGAWEAIRGETVMEGAEERVEKSVRWSSEAEWRVFGGDGYR